MAGRLGTVYGLIFGLVVVVAGSAALSPATNAESAGNRIAQGGPSVFAAPAQPNPHAQPARAGSPEQVKAIAHVQTCLAELGYYKGPVDGKRGRETWTAYWNFKHDHGLGGYSDLLAEPVRQKLDELCIETAAIEPSPGQRAETAATDVAPQPESSNEQDVAEDEGPRLDLDCLPDELIALLRRAHGAVAVNRCADSIKASSTSYKRRTAWPGAAPACRSTAISRSTTCGVSNAPAICSFAPRRRCSSSATAAARATRCDPTRAFASSIARCRRRKRIPTRSP